ncbi:polyribonucleotide nucleotidyltransferase [Patescibacteria group bacterium]|nr:polyribonucleotide nucleotidyltransferase [Patescibacteria group bacterium]
MAVEKHVVTLGETPLTIEYGRFAEQADAAVTVQAGETVVLATVVVSKTEREGIDYFPLMVDYEERLYAAGKISGSRFIKREGRPSEEAVLTSRLVDRPLRPLFDKNFRKDVQVIITVLSVDKENDPDILAIIAASCALMKAGTAPYKGPVGACRIGMFNGELAVNPPKSRMAESDLDLVVAGTKERVMMIEAGANQVPEATMLKALKLAHTAMQDAVAVQHTFATQYTTPEIEVIKEGPTTGEAVKGYALEAIQEAMQKKDREARRVMLDDWLVKTCAHLEGSYKQTDIKTEFNKLVEKEVRIAILERDDRPDGRGITEVRPISVEVGLLPRTHGSGLFTRGQTQALTIATLGSPGDEQTIETMDMEGTKRYMHHYNFPPFSTGEASPIRGASRREIGHGALAERALMPVIPSQEEFPYTIRLVSEILSSNGSSSMASTCGSTLALMDAGVPIQKPVSGIAMGLVSNDDNSQFKVLTDLQGLEDFAGEMDFKIAGTDTGITAIQMDTKIAGLTWPIIEQTLTQARDGRLFILEKMLAVLPEPRPEMSKYAPRIQAVKIDPSKIGELIGPGGKNINRIISECGGKEVTSIDIEEDGTVLISSSDPDAAQKAIDQIASIGRVIEIGEIFEGPVIQIIRDRMDPKKEIGAVVQFLPNKEGMVHISQIARERIEKVTDRVKVGDTVKVKVIAIDPEKGRFSLSIKDTQS